MIFSHLMRYLFLTLMLRRLLHELFTTDEFFPSENSSESLVSVENTLSMKLQAAEYWSDNM